jgi:hypothetical protein
VAQQVALSRGINLVLNRAQILGTTADFDLTPAVAEVLNKVLPSVIVSPDGVSPLAMTPPTAAATPVAATTPDGAAPAADGAAPPAAQVTTPTPPLPPPAAPAAAPSGAPTKAPQKR